MRNQPYLVSGNLSDEDIASAMTVLATLRAAVSTAEWAAIAPVLEQSQPFMENTILEFRAGKRGLHRSSPNHALS